MTLVDRIRVLANQRNMSLPDLEIKVGLGNGTISRWKNASPNTDKLSKVADELNVSIDYLLGREALLENSNKIDSSEERIYEYAKRLLALGMTPEKLEKLVDAVEDIQK